MQRLLQKLLIQQEVRPEILVVDQNPAGWLDDILSSMPSVKRLALKRPNASDARNQGFLASTGQVILFIDDDLVPEEDFCARGLAVFRDHERVKCFSPLVYNGEGRELALRQAASRRVANLPGDPELFSITDTISAALFFKREYFEKTGGFDSLLFEFAKTAEDQELFLRMRKRKLELFFVPFVEVFHDENIPGGCELRTADYWVSREKCMKSWAYRHRIHHHPPGPLSLQDLFQLARSGFLNREVLFSGVGQILRQARLLAAAIGASKVFLKDRLGHYPAAESVDHLN